MEDPETRRPSPTVTDDDKLEVLKIYGLACLSVMTMYRWLKILGFKYEAIKKYYFVDGHKTEETKQYRKLRVQDMVALETRMYWWAQMPVAKAKEHEEKYGLVYESGYFYTDKEQMRKWLSIKLMHAKNSMNK